jgi:hypothetical protein
VPTAVASTPQCCPCGRFISVDTAHAHIEYGDYGTVHSVEYECERCADPGYRCCGVIGGCGGPCAAYPCWELTT